MSNNIFKFKYNIPLFQTARRTQWKRSPGKLKLELISQINWSSI